MNHALIKLLIVDSEPEQPSLLAAIFTPTRFHVRMADEGFGALIAMRQETPDILVCALNLSSMHRMSSFELLSFVRRRFPEVHVVAISGKSSGAGRQLGIPADCFYEKGSDLATLLRMVGEATCHKRESTSFKHSPPPLWVHKHGHDLEGPYALIVCPDCLGVFPQSLNKVQTGSLHQTRCEHCQYSIAYAVLKPGATPISQYFERKPIAAAVSPLPFPSMARNLPRLHPDDRPALARQQPLHRLRPAG